MTTRSANRTRPESLTLQLAAAPAPVSVEDRTISGLSVPYGPIGNSSLGKIFFKQGNITIPSQIGRVKYLKQHDPNVVLGFAKKFDDLPDGLYGDFEVPPSPEGDAALTEASDGRRDGLSVGVLLSDDTLNEIFEKWWEGDDSPTEAFGELLEVSQVSIPAFRDARIDGSAAAALSGHVTLSVAFDGAVEVQMASENKENEMPQPTTVETPASAAVEPTTATASEPTPRPAPSPAIFAGSVTQVSEEAPVYTFDGSGPSFVQDFIASRFESDEDARRRLARFNQMVRELAPGQHRVMQAAVETRTTAPNIVNNGWKPELLVAVIDRGRPIISRLNVNPLTNAMPYKMPVEGDFYRATTVADGATTSGSATVTSATAAFVAGDVGRAISGAGIPAGSVIAKINSATSVNISKNATATATGVSITIYRVGISDHTEGTAHVTEGDLDINSVTVTPGAVSGAYRVSRELADASTPAIDRIALNAMVRDYRYATEAKVVAALASAAPTPVASVNTLIELRREVNLAFDDSGEEPDFIAAAPSYYATLLAEVDSTGRPMLASVNPVNAAGQAKPAGFTGANVDGVELIKALRVGGDVGYIVHSEDVHVAESTVQTFRFEEVEGPGIIKLALWGYFAAQVTRALGVRSVTSV